MPASLITILFFAFLGGLILNIMPCVLPVIALKVLGFVKQSAEAPGAKCEPWAPGVRPGSHCLVSGISGLRHCCATCRREVANWGDAFRNPRFQIALTILMTLIALNLFGVFEVTSLVRAPPEPRRIWRLVKGCPARFSTACWPPFWRRHAPRHFSALRWRLRLRNLPA